MNDELDFTVQLLEDAVRCFAVKRGEFYADKNFGSRIRQSRSVAEALGGTWFPSLGCLFPGG